RFSSFSRSLLGAPTRPRETDPKALVGPEPRPGPAPTRKVVQAGSRSPDQSLLSTYSLRCPIAPTVPRSSTGRVRSSPGPGSSPRRSGMASSLLNELHARGEAEFGVDVGEVGLHGAR